MKKIIVLISIPVLFAFTAWKDVFDMSIPLPEGDNLSLSRYEGKRLMIVILPSGYAAVDSALLDTLGNLNNHYKDSVTMIGIPSYEDGFADDSMSSLMTWYRTYLDSSFVIAGGMNTRKASVYQAPLFSYLTDASQNGYFDKDVYGAGEKFFINKEGNLYGISTPYADFNESIFREMLNKQTP